MVAATSHSSARRTATPRWAATFVAVAWTCAAQSGWAFLSWTHSALDSARARRGWSGGGDAAFGGELR